MHSPSHIILIPAHFSKVFMPTPNIL